MIQHKCKDVPYIDHRGKGYMIEQDEHGYWRLRIVGYGPPEKKLAVVCFYCMMCGEELGGT